jgi:hypothetical protein
MWLLNSVSGMLNGVIGDPDMYVHNVDSGADVTTCDPGAVLRNSILGCYTGSKLNNVRTDTGKRVKHIELQCSLGRERA